MLNKQQQLGRKGEKISVDYLKKKGYNIILCNYRCKIGEIDIIARDGKTLVFVEVKTRSSFTFGPPVTSITPRKQRQISRTAEHYLTKKKLFNSEARFDVVSVVIPATRAVSIDHIKHAFDLYEP